MFEVGYNALLLGVGIGGLLWLRRRNARGSLRGLLLLGAAMAATAVAIAAVGGQNIFGTMRVFSWLLFLHVPLVLLLAARRRRALLVPALLLAIGADAFLVEPRWLEVRRLSLPASGLDTPLRVVLLADIQTDAVGDHERRALALAQEAAPDLILLAGDYLQLHGSSYDVHAPQMQQLFSTLSAPLGVYAVRGDVEGHQWQRLFARTNVVPIEHSTTLDLGPLHLTALSIHHSRDMSAPIPAVEGYHIVLGHSPDFALARPAADLLLAGHVHGGQVRLPLIGPLITFSEVPRAWAAELTALPWGGHLVVSRGVGLERGDAPRLRFLCRPEVIILDLQPQIGAPSD